MRRPVGARFLVLSVLLSGLASAQFSARGRRPPPASTSPAPRTQPKGSVPQSESSGSGSPSRTTAAEERQALIARYQKIVLERPGDPMAIRRLTDLVRERDGHLKALKAELEALVQAGGDSAFAAQLALAEVAASDGDAARARRELSELVQKWPNRPEGHLASARLARASGDADGARASLERALPLLTGAAKEETLGELWQLCLEMSDLECAKRHHGALVRAARGNGFIAGELGRALLARGLHAEALKELRAVAQAAEGDRRALLPALRDLGRAQLVSGDAKGALSTLERASRLADAEPALRGEIDALRADAHRALGTLSSFLKELQQSGETADRLALLGRLYEELGQLPQAAKAYRRASELAPLDLDLRLALVRVLELTLELDEAEKELAKLVRQAPGQIDLCLRYIELLLAAGKRAQALSELDRAVVTFEKDAGASFLLLELAERLQEPERVRRIELAQAAKPSLSPKHLVDLGSRAYRQGDGDKARAIWKRLLTERDKTRGAVLYGETLLAHDDVKGGLEALERAVEGAPEQIEPKVALARGLLRAAALASGPSKKDYERRALTAWLAVLEAPIADRSFEQGTRAEARRQVVRLLKRTGRLTLEMAALERAFHAPDPNTDAGLTLAEAQILTRSLADAERTLTRLHELLPGDSSVLLRLERVQIDEGKTDAALGTLERLLAIDPARARETLGRLADLAFELHDDARALDYAERAANLDATDAAAWSKLGTLYERSGRLADAEAAYRRALAHDAQLHAVAIRLARLLSKRGENEEALGLLLRSLRGARRADEVHLLGQQALSAAVSSDLTRELEDQLRPLCISRPEAPALRALLLDLLGKERVVLEDRVKQGDEAAAREARAALAALADRNLGPLLSALASGELEQQEQVIQLLSWGQADDSSAALLEFAEGTAPEPLRIEAIEAASRHGDERSATRMVGMLRKRGPSPSGALSLALVQALSRAPGPEARRGLELALGSEDPTIRAEALLGLTGQKPPLSEATLLRIFADATEGHSARAAAALALGERPRSRAAGTALIGQLGQEAPIVQAAVLTALATQLPSDRRFLDAASATLLSADARLASAAMRALVLADPALGSASLHESQERPIQPDELRGGVEARLWQLMSEPPTYAARVQTLQRQEQHLVTALEVALKTSRTLAAQALRAMARSDGRAALAPLYTPDGPSTGSSDLDQKAALSAHTIHLAVLPWIAAHAAGSDRELASLALGTLCPDQGPASRELLERALRDQDDTKFEAAAFALAECRAEVALPLLAEFIDTKPAWPRLRRMAAVLEAMGTRQRPSVDDAIVRLLTRLAASENELVKSRATSAQAALGLRTGASE